VSYGASRSNEGKKFTYPATEKWDDNRIREAIKDITGKMYRVKKIELIEKEGVKPKVTVVPIPEPVSIF
jgi:hypothetical protein